MYNCVINSRLVRLSLDMLSDNNNNNIDAINNIVEMEFKNMCLRFGLDDRSMISLVENIDIIYLEKHYFSVWDGLNYYAMDIMDEFRKKYLQYVYDNGLTDMRILDLCDDLQEYIIANTCIHVKGHYSQEIMNVSTQTYEDKKELSRNDVLNANGACDTFIISCHRHHDMCTKHLLNTPDKHNKKMDTYFGNTLENTGVIDYLCICCASLDIIKYLFEIGYDDCTYLALKWSIVNGHIDVVKYLMEVRHINFSKDPDNECLFNTLDHACNNGHYDIVKYLFEVHHMDCSYDAIDWICEMNNLELMIYLFDVQNKKCTDATVNIACTKGHIDILKYLLEIRNEKYTDLAIKNACIHGHLDIIKYLFEKHYVNHTNNFVDIVNISIRYGYLDIVKYLFEVHHKDCSDDVIDDVCKYGHLDVIKYLFEVQHKKCTKSSIYHASHEGHFVVIKYLLEKYDELYTDNILFAASYNGHMDIIKYLIEKKNKNITEYAINIAKNDDIKYYLKSNFNTKLK